MSRKQACGRPGLRRSPCSLCLGPGPSVGASPDLSFLTGWAGGVLPGEAWGDSRYWGLLDSTLKPTSPGAPLGLLAPGSVQCPSAHFEGFLLGLEEAGPPPSGCFHGDLRVRM